MVCGCRFKNKSGKKLLSQCLKCEHIYRPQRSWGKVIFSQACVCPQGGVWSGPGRVSNFLGGLQFFGGLQIFFFFFFSISFPPKKSFWDAPTPPPPERSMRGRYASYWNAFLLFFVVFVFFLLSSFFFCFFFCLFVCLFFEVATERNGLNFCKNMSKFIFIMDSVKE